MGPKHIHQKILDKKNHRLKLVFPLKKASFEKLDHETL